MKIAPDSLEEWLRWAFVTCVTACGGLVVYILQVKGLGRYVPRLYVGRASLALQIALVSLALVSVAQIGVNRRRAIIGLIVALVVLILYPLVTGTPSD